MKKIGRKEKKKEEEKERTQIKKHQHNQAMLAHTFNPSTEEAEAGKSL